MKKGLSKKLACLVTLITVTSNTVAFAQDINKDETVYVILDENGNPTWQYPKEELNKLMDIIEGYDESLIKERPPFEVIVDNTFAEKASK